MTQNAPSFRKVSGPIRLSSNADGSPKAYRLPASNGGSKCKVIQYMLKVYQASANVKVGVSLDHGPDGEIYVPFPAQPIAAIGVATTPTLFVGATGTPDTDSNDIVGEWLVPVLIVQEDTAGAVYEWAIVELWELRKPF